MYNKKGYREVALKIYYQSVTFVVYAYKEFIFCNVLKKSLVTVQIPVYAFIREGYSLSAKIRTLCA